MHNHGKRWVFWGLAVFFYFYEYFLRVSPTVMVPELMCAFEIQAIAVGSLSSTYLYSYALLQLPIGMLMDRFGARKLLSFAALACGLGAILFGIARVLWLAEVGRLLMGAGSAFAFIGMVYICSHWFAENKIATLIAVGNSLGMIGAIGGEGPLALAVNAFGWRETMIFLGVIGILTAALNFFAIREDVESAASAKDRLKKEAQSVWQNIKTVASNIHSWIAGIGAFLYYTTTTTFAGLWGVPYLQSAYGFSKAKASFTISMIFVGWIIGGPAIGKFSDHIRNRKSILIFSALLAAIAISTAIYVPNLPVWLLYVLFILVGIFSSAENLTYCVAIELNPKEAKGSASAFTNFLLFGAGSVVPIFVGWLLERNWQGKQLVNGIATYSPQTYKIALSTFPIAFILAMLLFIFIKKSPISEDHLEKYRG